MGRERQLPICNFQDTKREQDIVMEWIPSFLHPTSSSSSSSSSFSIFGGYKLPRNQLLVAALCNFSLK
jgi:hypothetical protein